MEVGEDAVTGHTQGKNDQRYRRGRPRQNIRTARRLVSLDVAYCTNSKVLRHILDTAIGILRVVDRVRAYLWFGLGLGPKSHDSWFGLDGTRCDDTDEWATLIL